MNDTKVRQAMQQIADAHSILAAELFESRVMIATAKDEAVSAPKSPAQIAIDNERAIIDGVARPKTGFTFSKASLNELKGVNNDLTECVSLALGYYTAIDFRVFDGIRTIEEQRKYVNAGTSKTMKSKHLDGLAVDLVPIIGGIPKWDWVGCYEIAKAMDAAATELGIADRITWGGAWDRQLDDFSGDASAYAQAVEDYKRRHPGPDFIDGPHFEIRP